MVKKDSQTKKKRTRNNYNKKEKIGFKQKVLGTIGLGTLGILLFNRKESKIERTKKEIELYNLEKKLPWHKRYKFLTYLGTGILAYSLVACPEDYKKATVSLGQHIHQAAERNSLRVEEKRINEYISKIKEITEKAKETVQETKRLYSKSEEEKEKLQLENYKLQEELKKKEEFLRRNSSFISKNFKTFRNPNKNLEHIIFKDDYIEVIVQKGESISTLASKFYDGTLNADFYDRLGEYNGISNENLIYPGQVLKFPKDTSVLYN